MSVGMKAYAAQLAARLPFAAPDLRFVAFTSGANFSFEEQVLLPLRIARARPALTHYLSLYAPVITHRPYVVTIHDLIHLRFPQYFKTRVGPYYATAVRRLCARAARVITDDPRTIGDLQTFLGVAPQKVRVVPLGADDVFFRPAQPHSAARPYFLYAGNHREHKDLPTLIRAWHALPEDAAADVYVTGDDDLDALRSQYSRRNGSIVALGHIAEAELASYYAGAAALVHPALYEGFGLPMLEAMLQGCPVIACADAVPAVLAPYAVAFPARDARAASAAMLRMLQHPDERTVLAERARDAARRFTWDQCATSTAQVYREVLEDYKRP